MKRIIATLLLIGLSACAGSPNASKTPFMPNPYAIASGGVMTSGNQSNSDELEFGDEDIPTGAIEVGNIWRLDDKTKASIGAEIGHMEAALHGQNGQTRRTADGETFTLTTVMLNGRIEREIIGPVSVYAMVGAGPGYARAFGHGDVVATAQAEGGILYRLTERLSLGAGYRYMQAFGADLDGNRGDPSFQGIMAWLRWEF